MTTKKLCHSWSNGFSQRVA